MDSAADAPSVSALPHCAASLKVLFRGHREVEEAGLMVGIQLFMYSSKAALEQRGCTSEPEGQLKLFIG